MSELEFWVSICSLLVTSFISLLTIIINIWLMAKKGADAKKEKNYERHKEALIKYYMPIKFCLTELELVLRQSDGTYFDVFSKAKDTISLKTHKEVLEKYKQFREEFDKLPPFFTNIEIDKMICQIYTHISLVLLQSESGVLSENEFQLPNLQTIIEMIDDYAMQYQANDDRGTSVLIRVCNVVTGCTGVGGGFFLGRAVCLGTWWLYVISGILLAVTVVSMTVLFPETTQTTIL